MKGFTDLYDAIILDAKIEYLHFLICEIASFKEVIAFRLCELIFEIHPSVYSFFVPQILKE